MVACDSVSQNSKFLNFAKRCPIRGASVPFSIGTISGKQNVSNSAAWLGFRAYRQLMQSNLKRFSVGEIHLHSLAHVPLIKTTRVHRHAEATLLNGRDAFQ